MSFLFKAFWYCLNIILYGGIVKFVIPATISLDGESPNGTQNMGHWYGKKKAIDSQSSTCS